MRKRYRLRKHSPSICSEAMKRRMKELKIKPKQMSLDLCICRETIYHWLRGDRVPPLDIAYEVARYLDMSLDEMCGGDNDKEI